MTEPSERDQEMAVRWWTTFIGAVTEPEEFSDLSDLQETIARARAEGAASRPNLPPLFETDDWLWVIQSLGYVQFEDSDDGDFEARHRMDRIIAKLIEYRAEDVRKEQK